MTTQSDVHSGSDQLGMGEHSLRQEIHVWTHHAKTYQKPTKISLTAKLELREKLQPPSFDGEKIAVGRMG